MVKCDSSPMRSFLHSLGWSSDQYTSTGLRRQLFLFDHFQMTILFYSYFHLKILTIRADQAKSTTWTKHSGHGDHFGCRQSSEAWSEDRDQGWSRYSTNDRRNRFRSSRPDQERGRRPRPRLWKDRQKPTRGPARRWYVWGRGRRWIRRSNLWGNRSRQRCSTFCLWRLQNPSNTRTFHCQEIPTTSFSYVSLRFTIVQSWFFRMYREQGNRSRSWLSKRSRLGRRPCCASSHFNSKFVQPHNPFLRRLTDFRQWAISYLLLYLMSTRK